MNDRHSPLKFEIGAQNSAYRLALKLHGNDLSNESLTAILIQVKERADEDGKS